LTSKQVNILSPFDVQEYEQRREAKMLDWLVMLAVKLLVKFLKVLLLTLLAAVTPSDDRNADQPSERGEPREKTEIALVVEQPPAHFGHALFVTTH
jgi:hypothetical protein